MTELLFLETNSNSIFLTFQSNNHSIFLLFSFLNHKQTLQRASSVPTRSNVPEKLQQNFPTPRHEQTQSQDQTDLSQDQNPPPISASTTEESVAPTSMEPLLNLNVRGALNASNIKFELNGQQALPNLPNIIPLQGHLHQQGWL